MLHERACGLLHSRYFASASRARRQDKKQLWKPVTPLSVVIHIKGHQANWHNFINVHRNLTERCDDACMNEARCARPLPPAVLRMRERPNLGSFALCQTRAHTHFDRRRSNHRTP